MRTFQVGTVGEFRIFHVKQEIGVMIKDVRELTWTLYAKKNIDGSSW